MQTMPTCPTCGQPTDRPEPAPRAAQRPPRPAAEWERPVPRSPQDVTDRGLAAIRAALATPRDQPAPRPLRTGAATYVEQRAQALAFIASRAPEVLPLVASRGAEPTSSACSS